MKCKLVVIAIVLGIIACFVCSSSKKGNDMIKYETGIFHDKNWEEITGTYKGASIIPNEKVALRVAETIFDGMKKSEAVQDYVAQSVFYDNQDEIWIVTFWNNSDQTTLGGDCNIAIQKKDGKVLRIWFGE